MKYSVVNVVDNGWLNIEDDDHPLYWVKVKSSLSLHVFNNKVHNRLILCSKGQKRNSSNSVSKLKETFTALNLKVVQSVFHPDQLNNNCNLPKDVKEYFSKTLNNVKDKYQNYGEDELYTDN